MKQYRLSISLVVVFALGVSVSVAQATRAAFVDSEKILGELPEAQKASRELETLMKAWQDSLQKMNDDLQKQVDDYQKQESVMAPVKKEAEQRRLADLDQKRREFAAQKLDPQRGEVASEREKRLAPIREKVLRAIEAVAKEDGFTFVFDRTNVLYGDAKVDLTYKVIDRLKRGTPPRGK